MSFAAKFGGVCAKCAGHIPAGAQVNYDGKAIRHAPRCPAKGSVTEVPPPPKREDETLDPSKECILGKASYKGHEYLLLWEGTTRRGTQAAKLAFRDGSKIFWADGAYSVSKRYREALSLRKLDKLAEEYKREHAGELAARKEAERQAAMTPEQRAAQWAEIAAKAGRTIIGAEPRSFEREGKNSADIGEVSRNHEKKDAAVRHYLIVSVDRSYYHSADDCEDQDCFCGQYGHKTPYTAIEVSASAAEQAAEAEAARAVRLNTLCDQGAWAHMPDRSGRLKPEIEAEITERTRIWTRTVGYSLHQAWRINVGLLAEHPVYDDSPTWTLLRWEDMTPEDADIVRSAAPVESR